jgi:leader peptidase (prepilin peptidase)/N-methyltransferase
MSGMLATLGYVTTSGLVAIVDARTQTIPNRLLVLGVGVQVGASALDAATAWAVRSVIGAAVVGAVFSVIFFLSRGRLGLGDVKFAMFMGASLEPRVVAWSLFWSGVMSLVVVVPLLIWSRLKRDSVVAYGPFLVAGSWVALALRRLAPGGVPWPW